MFLMFTQKKMKGKGWVGGPQNRERAKVPLNAVEFSEVVK
jgi:hypothetical protein